MSYLKKEILKACISTLDIRHKELNNKYTAEGKLDSPTFSKWINGNKSVRLPTEQLNEIINFIINRIHVTSSSVEILLSELEQLYKITDNDFPNLTVDDSGKYLLNIHAIKYKEIHNYLIDKKFDKYITELILLEHEVYYDKYLRSIKNNAPDITEPINSSNYAQVNVVNGSFIENKGIGDSIDDYRHFSFKSFLNVKKRGVLFVLIALLVLIISSAFVIYSNSVTNFYTIPGIFFSLIAALVLIIFTAFVIYSKSVTTFSTILEKPSIIKITSPYSHQAQIVWNYTPDNEDGFLIERKEVGGKYELLEKITEKKKYYDSGNKENYYIDKNVSAGKEYFYKIKVFNATGESSYSKIIPVVISSVEPPRIKITSVGKNDTWFQGDIKEIEWVMEGDISHVNYSKIACIYDSDNKQVDIATISNVETRSFQWMIPQTVASFSARIRIKAFDKSSFNISSDISDYFSISR